MRIRPGWLRVLLARADCSVGRPKHTLPQRQAVAAVAACREELAATAAKSRRRSGPVGAPRRGRAAPGHAPLAVPGLAAAGRTADGAGGRHPAPGALLRQRGGRRPWARRGGGCRPGCRALGRRPRAAGQAAHGEHRRGGPGPRQRALPYPHEQPRGARRTQSLAARPRVAAFQPAAHPDRACVASPQTGLAEPPRPAPARLRGCDQRRQRPPGRHAAGHRGPGTAMVQRWSPAGAHWASSRSTARHERRVSAAKRGRELTRTYLGMR
jgi:hypothetical protein